MSTSSPHLVSRLTFEQRQQLLASVLSDRTVFLAARARLGVEYFNQPDEAGLRAVWVTALAVAERHGADLLFGNRAQTWNVMDVETKAYFRSNPVACPLSFYTPIFGVEPPGFLRWVYDVCRPEEFPADYGIWLLASFLRERAVHDPFVALAREAAGGVVTNLQQATRELVEKEAELLNLADDPVQPGAALGWKPKPTSRRPTGVVWLDSFLRGGHAAPEVYALSGVTGAGKTTLGLQILTSVAETELLFAVDAKVRGDHGMDPAEPYEAGHCYYFHYEMSSEDIRKKLVSGAAQIDYDRVELMGTKDFQLNSAGTNLSDAERAMLELVATQSGAVLPSKGPPGAAVKSFALPEDVRLRQALYLLSTNVWLVDMTGSVNKARGSGGVDEVVAILERERRVKKRKIAVVVVDYGQLLADRHEPEPDKNYKYLTNLGGKLEHQVGVPFGTPVWLLFQLSGQANERTAATRQHHSGVAGSKRAAENCWFAFNMGTADEKTGCRYFTCSKARRSNLGKPPVLKVAGGFNRLIDVSDVFEFDKKGKVKSKDAQGQQLKAQAAPSNGQQASPAGKPAGPAFQHPPGSNSPDTASDT